MTEIELIGKKLQELAEEAKSLADTFWDHHLEQNTKKPVAEKSLLGVRVRTQNDSLYIQWYWNKWLQGEQKGTHKPFSIYIKKGKSLRYPAEALMKHARPWESDLVLKVEERFAAIRKRVFHLVTARQHLREEAKLAESQTVEE